MLDWTVKEPANETEGKHVLRTNNSLEVHTRILERLLRERGEGYRHNLHRLRKTKLLEGVIRLVKRLFKILCRKRIGVANDDGMVVDVVHIHFQRSCVHRNEHISLVAWGVNALAKMHLETAHTAQRTLWGANFSWKIRES